MTTPEQLAKWREAFLKAYNLPKDSGEAGYVHYGMQSEWQGYLRAKQENEQAMRLARFGAMVAASHTAGDLIDGDDLTDGMLAAELIVDIDGNTNYADGIELIIMEVLK